MKQFIETICIRDGKPQNLLWHQRRVDATLTHFYSHHKHTWPLEECISVPADHPDDLFKCRIVYDAHHFEIHYKPFTRRHVNTLKIVEAPPEIDYSYKYADRDLLEELFTLKSDADDILISRNGWITDTSNANIAFKINNRWYTPSIPLLAGTTWKRLIWEGILIPRPINLKELLTFETFKVFNALHNFEETIDSPVRNIK